AKLAGGHKLSAQEIKDIKEKVNPLVKDQIGGADQLIAAVESLPENPYIFTAKPEQKNEARTRDKRLEEQIKELAKIKAETKKENPDIDIDVISPGEYLALQNRAADRAIELAASRGKTLDSLLPLDDYSRNDGTFSRFIDLPLSADGGVPFGYWYSGWSRLSLYRDGGSAHSLCGFRVSVRVKP
ncbi:MAG: hypothetical protein Q8L21_03115, partial [Candidatus Komeilibacteria bacterium]|nr:hypothetical protein [Candidatus Komeilibacteria bacterium]